MKLDTSNLTPKRLGYRFPAEWEKHAATWISWPHNLETWPGPKLKAMMPAYMQFIKEITAGELVRINVEDQKMKGRVQRQLDKYEIEHEQVQFYYHPTNDSWCRDHGPTFLVNEMGEHRKIVVDWEYNAWGGKYPPFDLDNEIPKKIGEALNLPVYTPGIVMEGGSVEFNGNGAVISTESCLLNKNRNPHLSKKEIERYLVEFYGVDEIIWLREGIIGDDTDGHIDDLTRFVNKDTVISIYENDSTDENFEILKRNIKLLNKVRLLNDKQLNVVELPMPHPVFSEGLRLPASYANFYISNNRVIVPAYHCEFDEMIIEVLAQFFPDRKVISIDSTEIIWGLGSFHCLSQQEPI
jgi:agmatine deiminase